MKNMSLEEGLLEHLKYSNVNKDSLSDAVKTIVEIANKTQTKPIRIFTKGIPWPDGWGWWNIFKEREELHTYLQHILDNYLAISIEFFPIGIPDPDGWLVENTLGAAKAYST